MDILDLYCGQLYAALSLQETSICNPLLMNAQTNGTQFLCYFFFSPETKYIRDYTQTATTSIPSNKTIIGRYLNFGKLEGTTPIRHHGFYRPLTILSRLSVSIPTLAHSVMFCFCSVLICVEIPGLLEVKFILNFESIGLNFMSNIIGYVCNMLHFSDCKLVKNQLVMFSGVIGELASGPLLDYFRNRRARSGKTGRSMAADHHLNLSYPAYALCIAGFVVFLVTLDQAEVGTMEHQARCWPRYLCSWKPDDDNGSVHL